jgi:hypothetical protein
MNVMQRSVDTNVCMTRHINGATQARRLECGALSNSHVGNSSGLQGYTVTSPAYRNMNDTFARTSTVKPLESDSCTSAGMALPRHSDSTRSSLRYPTQKLVVNGKLAAPISGQMKQQEGSSDSVRIIDRTGFRNGEVLLPSKIRLQNFPTAVTNGEGVVPEEPSKMSRSPQNVKQENGLSGKLEQMEGGEREPKISSSPPAAISAERVTSDPQRVDETEQKIQEPPAPVARLAARCQS